VRGKSICRNVYQQIYSARRLIPAVAVVAAARAFAGGVKAQDSNWRLKGRCRFHDHPLPQRLDRMGVIFAIGGIEDVQIGRISTAVKRCSQVRGYGFVAPTCLPQERTTRRSPAVMDGFTSWAVFPQRRLCWFLRGALANGRRSRRCQFRGKSSFRAATALDGRIYVVHGWDGQKPLSVLEIYDPAMDKWTIGPPMPTTRFPYAVAGVAMAGFTSLCANADRISASPRRHR
jgi:hypothetical protein